MSLPALYQIAEQYRDALELLGDMDLPEEVVRDTLEGLSGTLQVKAQNVAYFVQNIEALAVSIGEAEKKMTHRRKVLENKAERVRDYIKSCMESAGMTKIECAEFALTIKKNPPAVEIFDEAAIPDLYKKVPPPPPAKPDKKMISEVLKGGQEVPGAKLVHGTRLDVR